jgi:hypothetical protein
MTAYPAVAARVELAAAKSKAFNMLNYLAANSDLEFR